MSVSSANGSTLPILDALPAIRQALARSNRLVLAAPPGAGKTTGLPLDLLTAPWRGDGRILVLEPRRLAARMAAERLAASLGEQVGGRVGVATRIERRVSAATRIEVITDGLFARRVIDDPGLEGVAAVLFDEFHERSLNIDLGLALASEAQGALRPDLRLVLMSATLDTARVAAAFGAETVTSEGRAFPVETRYLGRNAERIDVQMARAVRRALRETAGSLLCFLPGRAEIERTAMALADAGPDVDIAPLFGAMDARAQDLAVSPSAPGRRKVVLATDIAESSLTIEGVHVVIDAGLARIAEPDGGGGVTLLTRRAARANVDQRRGRAGRLGPGICYRLWDEAETRGLVPDPLPDILSADLSGFLLTLAEWGAASPAGLFFLDAPPAGRVQAAQEELRALGAVDGAMRLTDRGRAMAALPLPPRLAALVTGTPAGPQRHLAAEIAAVLSEQGLGGASTDLRERVERFRQDSSPRARALAQQAARWASFGQPQGQEQRQGAPVRAASTAAAAEILARTLTHGIARRRDGDSARYLLASGRAARLDPGDSLGNHPWLVVAGLTGSAGEGRITACVPLDAGLPEALGLVTNEDQCTYETEHGVLRARRVRRLGAIVLAETPLPTPQGPAAVAALLAAVKTHGLAIVPTASAIFELLARIRFAFPEAEIPLSEAIILARIDEWLGPLLGDPPRLDRPGAAALARAVEALLDWPSRQLLAARAPDAFTSPAGRHLPIDYAAEGGPRVEARVQEFYGLATHPMLGMPPVPLRVSLLSPAQRQIAITSDLPAFWRGGYRDMARDMRSQYPRHDWPEDPAVAPAHVGKTKARLQRDGG